MEGKGERRGEGKGEGDRDVMHPRYIRQFET
jgi:hypothetical protein